MDIFIAMPKEEQIVTEGTVTQVLPGTMFRVELPGQRTVLAHISGKMRKHHPAPQKRAPLPLATAEDAGLPQARICEWNVKEIAP